MVSWAMPKKTPSGKVAKSFQLEKAVAKRLAQLKAQTRLSENQLVNIAIETMTVEQIIAARFPEKKR